MKPERGNAFPESGLIGGLQNIAVSLPFLLSIRDDRSGHSIFHDASMVAIYSNGFCTNKIDFNVLMGQANGQHRKGIPYLQSAIMFPASDDLILPKLRLMI